MYPKFMTSFFFISNCFYFGFSIFLKITSLKFVIILCTSSYVQNILTFSLLILLHKFSLIWNDYMFQRFILLTVILAFDSFLCYKTVMCRLKRKASFCCCLSFSICTQPLACSFVSSFLNSSAPIQNQAPAAIGFYLLFQQWKTPVWPLTLSVACPNLHPVGDSSGSPLPTQASSQPPLP